MKAYRSPRRLQILAAFHRSLDSIWARPLMRMLRAAFCHRGQHFGSAIYRNYGCGMLLNPNARRRWSVSLHDGVTLVEVMATNETQARCLVAFGESFYDDAIAKGLYLIHPDNIRNCVAGELDDSSDERSLDPKNG